jgi:succinate dehydrogenase/fumarate reductase cytochrome b subunit
MFSFAWAVRSAHQSGKVSFGVYALAVMLTAASVPVLAGRALFLMRNDAQAYRSRTMLYVMFTTSSLFSLAFTLSRLAGLGYGALSAIWISVWLAAGALLYFRKDAAVQQLPSPNLKGLRVTHGVTALCLLFGFVIAHLINHDLAAWSVELHATVLKALRLWYRSAWVQPILLGLFVIMICTGVPMVAQYSRRVMDFFRVIQIATGIYVGVFLCSHVLATLAARNRGVETDWFFAAGPASLLDGSLLGRLIPHYFFAAFFFCVHIACGLRIVLLQHGAPKIASNRVAYGVAGAGLVITVVLFSALLGFHIKS